jgi:hypothetical protein
VNYSLHIYVSLQDIFYGTVSVVAITYLPKDFVFGAIVSFHRAATELCHWQAADGWGEGDVPCSTMVNKGMYCPGFDIKYTRFWTIAIQKETTPQKCCHTTDGISPFILWMFAVSTVVCCAQFCCCIQTFTSPHFGLTVNMHGHGGSDGGRVLVYSFWPKANILTYFPTTTRHVRHWHKIVKNLKRKKLKNQRIFCFLWCYAT